MSIYEIGSPRGNDNHPNSPSYDSSHADACADQAIDGDLMMRHAPLETLRALADLAGLGDEDAVRELLMPLYQARPSMALQRMHKWFSESDAAADVAALAFERQYGE